MRRKPEYSDKEEEKISLPERLWMAGLAPLFFNASLVIAYSLFYRKSRVFGRLLLGGSHKLGLLLFALLIVIPAVAGFVLGVDRCATLLGHFFYTNCERKKSFGKTIAAWGVFLLIAYAVARALSFG